MFFRIKRIVACLALVVGCGCVAGIWPDLTPATGLEPPAGEGQAAGKHGSSASQKFEVQRVADLRYAQFDGIDQPSAGLCDVYVPKVSGGETAASSASRSPASTASEATSRRWPVVLVIHGGGWATGNKWTMDRHARQLAENGFAAVSINYRLAPAAKFPDQVDDVRAALAWIVDSADRFGFDLDRVGLYGYSAGGHLALMVATVADEPWDRIEPTTRWADDDPHWTKLPAIAAVCIGGPPTDFRDLPPDNTALSYFLGGSRRECPEIYEAASPICFASAGDPPIRIIQGEADGIVPAKNSKRYHQTLVRCGVDASLETLPGKGHLFAFLSPQLTEWMIGFFDQKLSDSN